MKNELDRKTRVLRTRVPQSMEPVLQEAVKQSGQCESVFVLTAIKEKLSRDCSRREQMEVLTASLNRIESLIKGQRTVQKLNFAATGALAKQFLRHWPELPESLQQQQAVTLAQRMREFSRMIAAEFHGEAGQQFEEETA